MLGMPDVSFVEFCEFFKLGMERLAREKEIVSNQNLKIYISPID